jgi:uncharacterized protein
MSYTEAQNKNIETVQAALHAALLGEYDRLPALIADDFVIYEAESLPFGGVFRGLQGYIECMHGLNDFWANKGLAAPEFFAVGEDEVIILSIFDGYIKKNGQHVEMPTVSLWNLKDGKVHSARPFFFDTKKIVDLAAL